ncbi:hypothetical protein BMS3Bbin01_01587 [bacterium BMS3Bbin01]|nr:hypothetical protein BMS3Bbin01_01587 [bacterium BMS3Bbin01]
MRDHTWAGRALRAILVVVMVLPLIGYFAPAASAHHPELAARPACQDEGRVTVDYTATSWLQDSTQDGKSGNSDIGIYILDEAPPTLGSSFNGSGLSEDLVGSGAFTNANGYEFSGSFAWPAGDTEFIYLMARADAAFNNRNSLYSAWAVRLDRPDCPPPPTEASVSVTPGSCSWNGESSETSVTVVIDPTSGATVTITGPGGPYVATGAGDVFTLDPGSYSWTVSAADGFVLTGPTSGELTAGGCPPPGSITVVKVTEGGTGTFGFSSKTLSPSPFDLTTTGTGLAGSDSRLFAELPAGTYDVAEGAPGANWVLTSAACSDKSDPSAIGLGAGESVTCTFTNTFTPPPGSITVVKVTEGAVGTFGFSSGSLSPSSFDLTTTGTGLAGSDSRTFAELPAGTYDVAEGAPGANWALTSVACSDGSDPSAIGLGAGESVTCTFTNTFTPPPGSITVYKQTEDESSTLFGFTLNGGDMQTIAGDGSEAGNWDGLDAGSYDLVELAKAGWTFTGYRCGSGDEADAAALAEGGSPFTDISRGVTIDLAQGDHVVCWFFNDPTPPPPPVLGSITVVKQTQVSIGTFSFSSNTLAPFSFELTTTEVNTPVSRLFDNLPVGIYDMTEGAPGANWTLTSATCSDGSDPSAIGLAAGEDVTCTFTNTFTQVSPTTVVNTTVTVAPTSETLPFTGASGTGAGGIGAALLLFGGLVALAFRKKEDPVVETGVVSRLDH